MSSFRGITFCLQDDAVSVLSCFESRRVELGAESVAIPGPDFDGELCLGFGGKLRSYLAILFLVQRACAIYFRKANIGRGVGGGNSKLRRLSI